MLLMAGCDVSPPARHSRFDLPSIFKDPKAQQLALAAEFGDIPEIDRLMKEEHVNPDVFFSEKEGMPLLAWSVRTQRPESLRAMLENGANPNAKQPFKNLDGNLAYHSNAMVWAAKQENPIYLIVLLDHGGDPNTRNGNDETLLFQAFIWHNQWRNVQLLIERGADINAMSLGSPILADYTLRGAFEKAFWLLEHGANPLLRTLPNESDSTGKPRHPVLEDIYWYPSKPEFVEWQHTCQQWLLQHGYPRPPMPSYYRNMRRDFSYATDEKDIPLPEVH